MAGEFATILEREERIVIAVYVQPLASTAPLSAADCVEGPVNSCVIGSYDHGTNTVNSDVSFSRLPSTPTVIERTIDFAMSHYEDLLRRLAD